MLKCICNYNIKVLNSAAGYYLGTVDEDGFPYCRISKVYYASKKEAEENLALGAFPIRNNASEVIFCNSGMGCQIKKA